MKIIHIQNRRVGPGYPAFTIAEIGSNHNRDKTIVRKLIDATAEAGFDAVKFQTYEPLEVFSAKITTADVHYEHLYGLKPWWEVARDRILMPREWFGEMFEYARAKGLMVFSTVHSVKDAEFLMKFDPPVFKVASIDVSYHQFLAELAKFGKPIILSTGMSRWDEIKEAVDVILKNGNDQLIVLHCVSCYPPKPEEVNLQNIMMLRERLGLPTGFSDHSPTNAMAVASIALGACVIEKHITLDRNMEGPDHPFALTPDLMTELIASVREVEQGLGGLERELSDAELNSRLQIRRSLVARRPIARNEEITADKLKMTRPGTGIEPKCLDEIIGRRAKVSIEQDQVLTWEMVQ